MTSERHEIRDERQHRAFRRMTAAYIASGMTLAAVYLAMENWYQAAQSLGTLIALGAVFAALKLLRIRPVYSYCIAIEGFLFASYTLGVACGWYKILPGYDKLLHMLSGAFTMMLALPMFYALKAGHRVEKSDEYLAAVFCLVTTMAAAGLWELAEYALGLVSPLDPQCVAETGVADTMKDMLVCLLGALCTLMPLRRFYRTGEGGLLYSQVGVFIVRNLETET